MTQKARVKKSELEALVDAFESSYMFEQPQPKTVGIEDGYIRVQYDRFLRVAPLSHHDLFTSFAKLAAHGEPSVAKINRWVGRFGLPVWGSQPEREGVQFEEKMPEYKPISMRVDDFRREAKSAHDLLHLYSLVRGRDAVRIKNRVRKLRSNLDEASELDHEFLARYRVNKHSILDGTGDNRYSSFREAFSAKMDEPSTGTGMARHQEFDHTITLLAAQSALGDIITSRFVSEVRLRLGVQRGQGLTPSYECPDLPSAIYLQFYLLVTKNKAPRFCENPACGELFFPTKSYQRHCPGPSCRSNALYHRKS